MTYPFLLVLVLTLTYVRYMHLSDLDDSTADAKKLFRRYMKAAIDFIHRGRCSGGTVFVYVPMVLFQTIITRKHEQ